MANSKNLQVFKGIGFTRNEKRRAEQKFKTYKEIYHIDSLSDLQLLESLIYREILQERTREQIKSDVKKKAKKDNGEIESDGLRPLSARLMKVLNENEEHILILKEKLGLFEDKKVKDPFKHIQILKKKFKKWREENQGSRTLICPFCSKMVMLKIRTKSWEALKHPFFKDRILANVQLWKLFREGKITKDDIAKVLGCSSDYIDWLEEKIYNKPSE